MAKGKKGKLSLAITNASEGLYLVHTENEEVGNIKEIASSIDDRNILQRVTFNGDSNFEDYKHIVYVISHAEDGCYLRLLRCKSGRHTDNQEAWIFIPVNLHVSSGELYAVIQVVVDAIKDTKISDYKDALADAFAKDYPVRDSYPDVKQSAPGKIAYRAIPKDGLQKVLGDNLFQSYYYDYENILFVDTQVSDGGYFENITDKPFKKWFTINKKSDCKDISVFVDDRELVNSMMLEEKKNYVVRYEKEHLNTIEQQINLSDGTILPNQQLCFEYTLKVDNFAIFASTDKYLHNNDRKSLTAEATIKIGDIILKDSVDVKAADLENGTLKVKIECADFEKIDECIKSEIPLSGKFTFLLERTKSDIPFIIRKEYLRCEKKDARFTLTIIGKKPKASPLPGYFLTDYDGKDYHLRPKWFLRISMVKNMILHFIIAVVILGIGFAGGIHTYKKYQSDLTQEGDTVSGGFNESIPTKNDSAFAYIINANILDKTIVFEELDSIGYGNFYNDLNHFDLNAMQKKWDEKLSTINCNAENWVTFKKIVDEAVDKNYIPTDTIYCKDGRINMTEYINMIKPK